MQLQQTSGRGGRGAAGAAMQRESRYSLGGVSSKSTSPTKAAGGAQPGLRRPSSRPGEVADTAASSRRGTDAGQRPEGECA